MKIKSMCQELKSLGNQIKELEGILGLGWLCDSQEELLSDMIYELEQRHKTLEWTIFALSEDNQELLEINSKHFEVTPQYLLNFCIENYGRWLRKDENGNLESQFELVEKSYWKSIIDLLEKNIDKLEYDTENDKVLVETILESLK